MRRILTASAVVAAVLLLLIAAPVSADVPVADAAASDDSPASSYTIYGYVSNISDQERNVPLNGVLVTLLDGDQNAIGTTVTDGDGRFEFTFSTGTARFLTFECEGYMVRSLPGTMTLTDSGLVEFSLEGVSPDGTGKYPLSGDGHSTSAVAMAITNGYIYGYIYGQDNGDIFSLEGALVTATSPTGRSYTGTAGSDGYFEIMVPYGEYTVSASCGGFEDSKQIGTSTSSGSALSITLDQKEFGIGFLGGIDTPHAMLILGLILIGTFLLLMLLMIRKSNRPESEIVVVNDIEDDIEHP